jgi:hypothetical protein
VKRSVPAIADRFYRSGGQWWHEKNVSGDYTLLIGDIEGVYDVNNVARVYTKIFTNSKMNDNLGNSGIALGFPWRAASGSDNTAYIGYTTTLTDNRLYFMVAKGTTIAQARTLLTGTVIRYQLATPVLTPIQGGEVLGFANSTAYVEAWDEEVVECTVDGQITCSYKPATIESLKAYDGGYEWDVVADSISGNTVYISEAVVGYVYKIAHYYSDETMIAQTEVKPATKNLVTKITALEAKVGAAVSNATSETALAQLNALLASLRTAGLLTV